MGLSPPVLTCDECEREYDPDAIGADSSSHDVARRARRDDWRQMGRLGWFCPKCIAKAKQLDRTEAR